MYDGTKIFENGNVAFQTQRSNVVPYRPQAIKRYDVMKLFRRVVPPLSGFRVGEVGKHCRSGPNLQVNIANGHQQKLAIFWARQKLVREVPVVGCHHLLRGRQLHGNIAPQASTKLYCSEA